MTSKPKRRPPKQKLPDPVPNGFSFRDIFKRTWVIGHEIGSGGFGRVYTAKLSLDESSSPKPLDCEYVVKTEYHENGPLFTEAHFYSNACNEKDIESFVKGKKLDYLGIPPRISHGSFEHSSHKYRYLILERYGKDLQKILQETGRPLNLKTAYTVAISQLHVIEYIHSKGYCHGDIKGANLLLGHKRGTENRVYLVDMGLALKYVDHDNSHKKEVVDKKKMHNGTIEFTSCDCHRGTPTTRRSDLEILGYNLVYWLTLNLPWKGFEDPVAVGQMKSDFMNDVPASLKKAFQMSSVPPGLADYFKYVNGLTFNKTPDYDHCRKVLTNGATKAGSKIDGKLDFRKSKAENSDDEPSTSSKENSSKRKAPAERKPPAATRTKKKLDKTPLTLDPNITPTPAMLAVLQKRNEK